jgi:hypothetical protein
MSVETLTTFSGALSGRKNALRKRSFTELSALPQLSREALPCRDAVGRLGIFRRSLPDGALLVMLRCEWSAPAEPEFVHYVGFVKLPDDSWSEQRPEIFDKSIRAEFDQSLRTVCPRGWPVGG